MRPIASMPVTRRLLQEIALSPNRLLGQNFLIRENMAQAIVEAAGIIDGAQVLEIGPGLGALSEHLASLSSYLTLLEVDERLAAHLKRLFADNKRVEVICGDALIFDYVTHARERLWKEFLIISNLPYSITTALIERVLLWGGPWHSMVFLMQSEVAQKLLFDPSANISGPLSLLIQYFGSVNSLFTVGKECFFPTPQVESTLIKIERYKKPAFSIPDPQRFACFLKAAFSHRRKTLINSLSISLGKRTELWRQALDSCGVGENKRAEQLTLEDYVSLYDLYERM